jgi:hypothetical protein
LIVASGTQKPDSRMDKPCRELVLFAGELAKVGAGETALR